MKKLPLLLALCCAAALQAAPAADGNLLPETLTISNPATTTLQDKVYTVVSDNAKAVSAMTARLELNQTEALPLTFAAETKAENREEAKGGNYGVRIDLVFNDDTKVGWVNVGAGDGAAFDWKKVSRTYQPAKPVKSVTFYLQFQNGTGKVQFRSPALTQGTTPIETKK